MSLSLPGETAKLCLHGVIALAETARDPAADLLAAWQVTGLLAALARPQEALDLAESLLVQLPALQAGHRQERLSGAWLCYASVELRLGNVPAALRYCFFATVTMDRAPLHARIFLNYFRTAARLLRDMRITPLALRCLEIEREMIGGERKYQARERELEQMELSVLLMEWTPGDGAEAILEVAEKALDVLDHNKAGEESAPLLSVAAQALQLHEMVAESCANTAHERLQAHASRLPRNRRAVLQAVMPGRISVKMLRTLATRSIRSSADWSLALKPALVAARRALAQAVDTGDGELFWMACLILCQPGLGVRISERVATAKESDPITATKWMARQIEAGKNPVDAVLVQRAMSNASGRGIGDLLFQVALGDFLDALGEDESVTLLATDSANALFRAELRKGQVLTPVRVGPPDWDYDRFKAWSQNYPGKYGLELKLYFGHVRNPPPAEVRASLGGLLPAGLPQARLTTVITEGRLFSFAHRLAAALASSDRSLAVCPSARWLHVSRQRPVLAPGKTAAWLGQLEAGDQALEFLHKHLPPIFQRYGVSLSGEPALPVLKGQSLVILGAHGEARNGGGFLRLGDAAIEYEPDQVAERLEDSGCVVLFVCHGGRGDEAMYSHETSGLTSSLLRHGVRAVVAALWPLDAELAVAWLEEFALTDPQQEIAVRVDQAQRKMAQREGFAQAFGEHPLVRSAFTVFGDGSVRVPFPEPRQNQEELKL